MKQNACHAFPVTRVVVMVALLSVVFFGHADLSDAATAKKKVSAVDKISAVEYAETQIKQLQGALNITEAQKELWSTLTQVMRENAKDMDALTKEVADKTTAMTSVERMKVHRRITEAHLDELKKFIPPFEKFYTSMSDQQKNITDKIFLTGKYDKPKGK